MRCKYRKLILLFFLFLFQISTVVFSQNENKNWVVGNEMGLDFNTPPITGPGAASPFVAYNNPNIENSYGRKSSISDKNGKLIFTTDGFKVWNKDFELIEGGNALINNVGSQVVRESLIVKSGCRIYHIFSLASVAPGVFRVYKNRIDIGANNGQGKVIEEGKSSLVYEGNVVTLNAISGYGHMWLFLLDLNLSDSGSIRVYKIFEDEEPVFDNIIPLNLDFLNGQSFRLKFSKDAKTINIVRYFLFEELSILRYNFDRSDGSFSFLEENFPPPAFLQGYFSNHIDIEFSDNGVFAYVLSRFGYCEQLECFFHYKIFQYEIDRFTQKLILSSEEEIYYSNDEQPGVGNLTKGPRGKIYLNRFDTKELDVIFSPNSKGESSGYRQSYITWPEGSVSLRMPNQVVTEDQYFRAEIDSEDFILCKDESINISFGDAYESVIWKDGYVGMPRTVDEAGIYAATLINGECIYEEEVIILESEPVDGILPLDTVLCNLSEFEFIVDTTGFENLTWSDGYVGLERSTAVNEVFNATFEAGNCTYSDSLVVDFVTLDDDPLISDTTLCEGEILNLGLSIPFAEFEWSNGNKNPIIRVEEEGTYSVEIRLSDCIVNDSIVLNLNKRQDPTNSLNNSDLCLGDSIQLYLDDPNIEDFVWTYSGDSEPWARPGSYIYEFSNESNCWFTDTLSLNSINCTEFAVYSSNVLTLDGQGNGFFKLFIDEGVEVLESETTLFDRWGNKIHTTNDLGNIWDGYINNKPANPDTYMWVGKYSIIDKYGESIQTASGTVSVLR